MLTKGFKKKMKGSYIIWILELGRPSENSSNWSSRKLLLLLYIQIHLKLDFLCRWALVHTVERQLISDHLGSILGKGLESLLDNNRVQDLTLMYTLFTRVKNGLIELCSHFNSFIKVLKFSSFSFL